MCVLVLVYTTIPLYYFILFLILLSARTEKTNEKKKSKKERSQQAPRELQQIYVQICVLMLHINVCPQTAICVSCHYLLSTAADTARAPAATLADFFFKTSLTRFEPQIWISRRCRHHAPPPCFLDLGGGGSRSGGNGASGCSTSPDGRAAVGEGKAARGERERTDILYVKNKKLSQKKIESGGDLRPLTGT